MAKDTIIEFVKHINNHNVEEITKLLCDDHCFVDAYGQAITGKAEMKKAWEVYFEWFPDYVISVSEIISGKHCISMFGFASGTYKGYKTEANSFYWRLPAAWKIIVENDKIKHWQVYCDTKVPSQVVERDKQLKVTTQPVEGNKPLNATTQVIEGDKQIKPPPTSQFYK